MTMEGYIVTDSTTGQQQVDLNEWAREFAAKTYVGPGDNYIPGSQFGPSGAYRQQQMGGDWMSPQGHVVIRQGMGGNSIEISNVNININGAPGYRPEYMPQQQYIPQQQFVPQQQFIPPQYYAQQPRYSQFAWGPQGGALPQTWYYRQPDYRLPMGYDGSVPMSNLPAFNGQRIYPPLWQSPDPAAAYWNSINGRQPNQYDGPIQSPNFGPQYVPQRQFGRTPYGGDPNFPALQMTINSMVGHSIREYDPSIPENLGCARFVSAALNLAYKLPVYDSECNALERDLIGKGYQLIDSSQMRPGDVIIAHRAGTRPGHAAIYMGNGQVANNSSVTGRVEIQSINKFNSPDYVSVDILHRTS